MSNIRFEKGIVIGQGTPAELYKQVMPIIYDAQLPVLKALGFKLTDNRSGKAGGFDRHLSVMENMLVVACNVSKLVFDPITTSRSDNSPIMIELKIDKGTVTSGNSEFKFRGVMPVKVIDPDVHIIEVVEPITLRLMCIESTGYSTMEESVNTMTRIASGLPGMSPETFMPLNVAFDIREYVRILPPIGNQLRYTLHKGMTDELLNKLWGRR